MTTVKDKNNGLTYIQLGDYLVPNLVSEMKPVHGKYAEMRFWFLKEKKKITYTELLTTDKLNEHLQKIQDRASQRVELLVKQMAKEEQVTEELKMKDPMKWVQLMNNIKSRAEEVVVREIVYS
nr:TnpV protein [Ruminococcus sp. 1001270H_150608_F2]